MACRRQCSSTRSGTTVGSSHASTLPTRSIASRSSTTATSITLRGSRSIGTTNVGPDSHASSGRRSPSLRLRCAPSADSAPLRRHYDAVGAPKPEGLLLGLGGGGRGGDDEFGVGGEGEEV